MSLNIDVDTVTEVLLADGWHDVAERSFGLDAYEYLWSGRDGQTVAELEASGEHRDSMLVHGGGRSGICSTGFAFRELTTDAILAGPLTSVLAVRFKSR